MTRKRDDLLDYAARKAALESRDTYRIGPDGYPERRDRDELFPLTPDDDRSHGVIVWLLIGVLFAAVVVAIWGAA